MSNVAEVKLKGFPMAVPEIPFWLFVSWELTIAFAEVNRRLSVHYSHPSGIVEAVKTECNQLDVDCCDANPPRSPSKPDAVAQFRKGKDLALKRRSHS